MRVYSGLEKYISEFTPPRRKMRGKYIETAAAFDIETTTKGEKSYMYIAQLGIERSIILLRTWTEVLSAFDFIADKWRTDSKHRLIIWVHNFSYEFSFLKFRLRWAKRKDGSDDIFALTNTRIIKAVTEKGLEFRCSYVQSGYSLALLAKNFCQTQKMVGDLDYKVLRNSKTPLTEKEIGYCVNDVEILLEYADYLYKKFPGKIPLTKTGVVRDDIKKDFKSRPKEYKEAAHIILRKSYPDEALYNLLMSHLYAGGYAHANYIYVGDIIFDVASFDFKSAYPAECFNPLPYQLREIPTKRFADCIKAGLAVMAECVFYDLSTKTTHAIFSRHKAEPDSSGILSDNGRVRLADKLHCWLTEYDFFNFQKFYSWEDVKIKRLFYAEKKSLPAYVLDNVYKYYRLKNSLPKGTPEYAASKANLNSIYGMMVTGLYHDNLIFDKSSGDFYPDGAAKPFWKLAKSQILLPQWGVWVTAAVRYHLLSGLCSKMADDWVYSDTDSGKILNYKKHLPEIESYNKKILARNEKIKKEKGYDIGKLGIFDFEGVYQKFKTLGAKRYIYEQDGKVEVTCAGLPKNALPKYCAERGLDIWKMFDDKMLLSASFSGKLRTKYTNTAYSDTITDKFGHTERMTEKSGVCLLDTPFQISMASDYVEFLTKEKEKRKREYR